MIKYSVIIFVLLSFYSLSYCQNNQDIEFKQFFYPNKQVSSEGYFKNGLPIGLWKTYNINGTLKSEGYRKNNLLDSIWIFYDDKDDTIEKINYLLGKKNGYDIKYYTDSTNLPKVYELFVNDRKEGYSKYFYASGHLQKLLHYENNVEQGLSKEFSEDGRIISIFEYNHGILINYETINQLDKNGEKDGIWREYYPDNKIKSETVYSHGLKYGLYKEYNKNGELIVTYRYEKDSLIDNKFTDTLSIDFKKEYFDNGNVSFEGGYRNNIPIGIHRWFDDKNEVIKSFIYDNFGIKQAEGIVDIQGRYQGYFKFYYPDGLLKSSGNYSNGRKTGKWFFYFRNGKIEQTGNYKNGYTDGKWIWYYENGHIFRNETYDNGKEDDEFIEFYIDSTIIARGLFLDGLKDGEWFYDVGDHIEKGKYINGLKEGLWQYFYPSGTLMYRGKYLRDLPDGKHKYYYENGKIKEEQFYNNGTKERNWKKYDPAGNCIFTIFYKNDQEYKINGIKVNYSK